jgi:hypothetical protein
VSDEFVERAVRAGAKLCKTPFGYGFIGKRSGRPIYLHREDNPRETNVLDVTFRPIDESGSAYIMPLTRRELGVLARRCRACGGAGHDRRKCRNEEALQRIAAKEAEHLARRIERVLELVTEDG